MRILRVITTQDLRDFLREQNVDTSELEDAAPLFSSGLVDSFIMVDLLLLIESRCAIRIQPTEVNLDNFDSIRLITEFVERRTKE